MPRINSARSDTSDADAEGIAEKEQELAKLRRQYRIMQEQREAYTEESQNLIRKQRSELEQLESEKSELLVNLRLAESRSNQQKDVKHCDDLVELSEEKDQKDQEIEDEKQNHIELDTEIRKWERKIRDQHKNMGGVNMSRQHTIQTQKKIRVLENRLHGAMKEFNNTLTQNGNLREEIDSLRVERKRYENLYRKLDKEIQQLRLEIGEVIDNSTTAYDSRDEAQAKMMLLKEKADKDIQQHNAEMKELIRIIEHDKKLKEFMGVKGQERPEDPQLTAHKQKKAREAEKKKESAEDSVETYETAIEKMIDITGEEDLDQLVTKFIETEDQNFALFNYVNELNNETEMLQEQIQEIQEEISKFKQQGADMEEERKRILKKLSEKQEKSSKEADEHDSRFTAISKILDQLRAGVESLFNKISCNRAAIDEMLGAHQGVTDQTLMEYLGIIEQRTNELLAIQAYINYKDYEKYDPKAPALLGEGPQPPAQPQLIFPPSVGDEYESEASDASDDDRPFTRNELQVKVIKTVRKRESAAKKEGFKYDLSNAREKAAQKQKKKDDRGKN
ncbi:outer dynein arm-docking complex subunit 1-like [Tubulanus polymorphus]|uniref:outer dynein arm-docking complex subunit 1-like n=1 Tax=Tubulanus polymorphus TaxID=672921 RepID=UPI003DA448ED